MPIKNGAKKGSYVVIVRFIVDKTGKLVDFLPETKLGFGMEEEVIRVLKLSPKWIPGEQNGVKVSSVKRQPLTFVVE